MKYAFIAAHAGEHAIERLCQALDVGRSGYYAWRKRQPSRREQANQVLLEQIRQEHQASQETYGSPRIQAVLQRQGFSCSRKRVARLMREHDLVGRKRGRRHPGTTRRNPAAVPAPNVLNQDFSAQAPNRKWVTDITYIDTAEGWLYLAPVLDLYSRRVVGWAMADHMETPLVEAALAMALAQRHPPAGLLHHSDQGSQYTSLAYQARLAQLNCQVSMSRRANCYDNAVMESFFSTLKTECATGQFATRQQARTKLFEFIEVWYNRRRLHSYLGYLSPLEFEQSSRH